MFDLGAGSVISTFVPSCRVPAICSPKDVYKRQILTLSNRNEENSMNYDIVELEEKTVAAISARTNNTSPDMGAVIGGLWERFFSPDLYPAIEHKSNEKALGIYTDYALSLIHI